MRFDAWNNALGSGVHIDGGEMKRDSSSERALIEQLQAGVPGAVETLASAYGSKVYQLAFRYMKNREDAEEVTQDVLMKVVNKVDAFRGDAALSSWIYRITRNAIADHYRQFRQTEPLDEQRLGVESFEPVRTEGECEALITAFRRLITELPEPYREAIELTELQGMSQSELAERLGISLSGAKSRVQRARACLKEALLACCRLEFDRRGGVVDCQARSAGDCPECAH